MKFLIGQKVDYFKGVYMKNGVVTGLDEKNNRVFVKWTHHGSSSINANYLILKK
jgi:hypothetical protein